MSVVAPAVCAKVPAPRLPIEASPLTVSAGLPAPPTAYEPELPARLPSTRLPLAAGVPIVTAPPVWTAVPAPPTPTVRLDASSVPPEIAYLPVLPVSAAIWIVAPAATRFRSPPPWFSVPAPPLPTMIAWPAAALSDSVAASPAAVLKLNVPDAAPGPPTCAPDWPSTSCAPAPVNERLPVPPNVAAPVDPAPLPTMTAPVTLADPALAR